MSNALANTEHVKSLTKSETNYSQLDKEATAVYWGIKKYYKYLYGRKFKLFVDNKPLEQIFNPKNPMPVMSAHRLLRYVQLLSGFDYEISQRSSKNHQNVEYFSRNPLQLDVKYVNDMEDSYNVNQITINTITDTSPITVELIRSEIEKELELKELKQKLQNGTLKNAEFTLHAGIIMRGTRVYIPTKLRPIVLKELHSSHIGFVKMKTITRSLCYWPGIDAAIENFVNSCKNCAEVKKNPSKVPLHHWKIVIIKDVILCPLASMHLLNFYSLSCLALTKL